MGAHYPTGAPILGGGENNLTCFTMLFQVVVWQKSRVSDHRAALMAVIGAASMANMLPLQHRQEHPEVSKVLRKHKHICWTQPVPMRPGFQEYCIGHIEGTLIEIRHQTENVCQQHGLLSFKVLYKSQNRSMHAA